MFAKGPAVQHSTDGSLVERKAEAEEGAVGAVGGGRWRCRLLVLECLLSEAAEEVRLQAKEAGTG